ncbi:hypothetical protein [Actinacidiphila sp. ITFR-21]|uniref:hypothetical protein n=1 Tax=Actinacidiphila sp. ITFR-21 TaxID=3075199 RepID=UPI00288C4D6C|nr:hypothetical protein [Streptomyces sp. ITFR-21]WNI16812.1 hypothetical protein RLT57_15665 [Streptomyces sp. ITFR-21]
MRFRVVLLRDGLSPGADGLRAVHEVAGPTGRDLEEARPEPTGEVVRVLPRPADVPDGEDAPPAPPRDLREPLTAHRTAYVDLPGSADLERHITRQLRALDPGILPPLEGGRTTPQAVDNERVLRERVAPSALRAGGGRLLDGTFRITLDASHLPGRHGNTYEVVVRADLGGPGRHHAAGEATAKSTVARSHAADKGVTRGSKHTVGLSGNGRTAMNPMDTRRVIVLGGVDGTYAPLPPDGHRR